MRYLINLLLIGLIAVLGWLLYGSISEPIKFKAEFEKRERAVTDRLIKIRKAQEYYRAITGEFAPNFDTLKYVLNNGQFKDLRVFGDPDDPTNTDKIRVDTIYTSASDSLATLGFTLGDIETVPYSNGVEFNIQADTLTYQSTLVTVCEVGTSRKNYMGPYADERFAKYDQGYDPNKIIKFGNMNTPNLSGNWE